MVRHFHCGGIVKIIGHIGPAEAIRDPLRHGASVDDGGSAGTQPARLQLSVMAVSAGIHSISVKFPLGDKIGNGNFLYKLGTKLLPYREKTAIGIVHFL